jgi:P27 family predicted phage terminase small subunit
MAGRRPKPDETKIAQGNPGKRPIATDKVVEAGAELPEVVDTDLPALLKDRPTAAVAWRELAPLLKAARFVRETDARALARYCVRLAAWQDAITEIEAEGRTYWTDSNHGKMKRINPAFIVAERLEKGLLDYEDRFGLNPAARQRLISAMAAQQPTLPLEPAKPEPQTAAAAPTPSPVGALSRARVH